MLDNYFFIFIEATKSLSSPYFFLQTDLYAHPNLGFS